MRRFVFRLHRLERLREAERRQARSSLAASQARLADRERRRAWMERERRDANALGAEDDSASSLRRLAAWREDVHRAVRAAREREAGARREAAEAFERYDDAARAHAVLEKLRERRRSRWMEEAAREEQLFLDEIHLIRVARERTGNPERS